MEKSSRSIDYLGFAAVDWWYHNRAHSELQLLTRLARDHKVLVINSIGMRMPLPGKTSRPLYKIWRKLKSITRLLKQPEPSLPNFYVYSPLPWPFYGSEIARRFGAQFVRAQVAVAARVAGIENPAILTTTPLALPVIARMKRQCLIYNRSDKHSLFREANAAVVRDLEEKLLEIADFTLYTNKLLMTEERSLVKGRGVYLDHGVDFNHFDYSVVQAKPDDLARIPKPIVGFFGNLRAYAVDFSLLSRIARDIPEAQIVLIGDAQDSVDELKGLKNIHFLGKKSYAEIPAYGAFFDVALVPYQNNDWIRYCNPIKMKEYLALGLVVVSSDFSEAHNYDGRIWIASNGDEMVQHIRHCLANPIGPQDRQKLRASVAGETWDARAQRLADYVDGFVRDQSGSTLSGPVSPQDQCARSVQ